MPSCFQLTRKGDSEPSSLQHIDCCLCQHFELPWSADKWAANWYNNIGLMLAIGHSFEKIIDTCNSITGYEADHANLMMRMSAYLNEHYTSDAWHQHGWD